MTNNVPSTSELLTEISRLKKASESLEPDGATRSESLEKVAEYVEQYLESVHQQPGYSETPDMGEALWEYPICEEPLDLDTTIRLYRDNVDAPGSHPTSPTHLAYIPVSSSYFSALGDYLGAVTNRFSGNSFAGPGAVHMENLVLSWMKQLVSYPKSAAGNLTSGGSIANLSSIVTARESHNLKSKDYQSAVVYLSEHTHHSIHKALHIAGMSDCIQRIVDVDEQGRMQVDSLEETINDDRKLGLNPWLLVASAGTTNLGSVDPLAPLGDIADVQKLWFHVDAAYGGFFLLSEVVRDQLKGINRADSVVLDPHKSLYVPFGTGAVLVKDGAKLHKAHAHTADYLQDAHVDGQTDDPSDLGPELTRHFRALRIWMPLKLLGVRPYRAALSEKVWLARYAYRQLGKLPGIELGPYPQLSIFVFRYKPASGDTDEFNRNLVEQIRIGSRLFLSSTVVNGQYMIRFPVLSFSTHLDSIELALEIIKQKIVEAT